MPATFVPARWLSNAYAQTAFSVVARRLPRPPLSRERWETDDGDFIDLDFALPEAAPRGFVLLVHGLEGSSRSPYMLGMLELARLRGLAGVAMNLRSCSGELNRLARSYHSGETGDLRFVVRRLAERFRGLRGAIAGFSLGANITLKWLSEEGAAAPDAIAGAVAVSCPFDLAACATTMDAPAGVWLRFHFLRTLRRKALAKAERFPQLLDPRAIRRASTFRAFDDIVTAPLHGFRDALHYWSTQSSAGLLGAIARPTLVVSAEDDPLIPASSIPRDAIRRNAHLTLHATSRGGHVGFVAGSALQPRFWAEEQAMDFVGDLVAR